MTKERDEDVGHEIRSQVGGWAMVPNWVLTIGLRPGELAIYVAMRSFADRNGQCWPKADKIAERACGASVGSVHNALTKFRKIGIITSEPWPRANGATGGVIITMCDLPPNRPSPQDEGRDSHSTVSPVSPQDADRMRAIRTPQLTTPLEHL